MKVSVKNTFIDISSPEEGTEGKRRGSQTCQARLSDPASLDLDDDDEDEEDRRHRVYRSCPEMSMPYDVTGPEGYGDTPMVYGGHPDAEAALSLMVGAGRQGAGLAPLSPSRCRPEPPGYAAPCVFEDKSVAPTPMAAPGELCGRQAFTPLEAASVDLHRQRHDSIDSAMGGKVVVKNTFIDFEDEEDEDELDDRQSKTCTARFSGAVSVLFPPTPQGPRPTISLEANLQPASELQPGVSVSVGSAVHGLIEDGQPVCQPCAWFYKESGCLNAAACRYCHLCPQGELKSRKKQKIARLRSQESATAAPDEDV